MRIEQQSARHFWGTHKGAQIQIDREPDGTFYIIVTTRNGGTLYDGWAPRDVVTMAQAKRQAVKGACLDRPKLPRKLKMLHGLPVSP
ncbi:hypothetical protein [Methylobacterium gossipiicola]|uniref:Uncharacterized protein n=1 Tax=Methylobacterium gossipiicola TaxID=582675 RepID=A0A1I2VAX8_9HYPH|nr:hypothetical protein [Methylobacterium gossipiicola]SFG85327.1 hypothetical protein SAMN05192565_113121 [Methylobacterium gossipiicola]